MSVGFEGFCAGTGVVSVHFNVHFQAQNTERTDRRFTPDLSVAVREKGRLCVLGRRLGRTLFTGHEAAL